MIDTAAIRCVVAAAAGAPVSFTPAQIEAMLVEIEGGQAAQRQLVNLRTLINLPVPV